MDNTIRSSPLPDHSTLSNNEYEDTHSKLSVTPSDPYSKAGQN